MWSLVILVIAILLGIYEEIRYGDFFEGFWNGIGVGCVIIFILFLISDLSAKPVESFERIEYSIEGLENKLETNNINGAFILGMGSISSEDTMDYYFFRVDEKGKKLEKIDGTNIYIRETDSQEPCLIGVYEITKYTWIFKWLFGENPNEILKDKILVVPENTVKIDYNVDI